MLKEHLTEIVDEVSKKSLLSLSLLNLKVDLLSFLLRVSLFPSTVSYLRSGVKPFQRFLVKKILSRSNVKPATG